MDASQKFYAGKLYFHQKMPILIKNRLQLYRLILIKVHTYAIFQKTALNLWAILIKMHIFAQNFDCILVSDRVNYEYVSVMFPGN